MEYTQHSVAWPTLKLPSAAEKDEVFVDPDKGAGLKFTFYQFSDSSYGVALQVFGDGLGLLYDRTFQKVMKAWRSMPNPDEATPKDLIAILEANGATPSEYHERATRLRVLS